MKTRLLASAFVVLSVMLFVEMLHSQTASQTTASPARDQGSSTEYASLASQHSDIVLHAEVPMYPFLAVQARIQGIVRLHVFVEQGEVIKVESNSPSNLRILAQAATENVNTWRFVPVAKGTFDVTYIFKLKREKARWRRNPQIQMQLPELVEITAVPVVPTVNYGAR